MVLDKDNRVIIFVVLFFLFLAISIISFLFFSSGRTNRILFFINEKKHILTGELRRLPVMSSKEEDIRILMEDYILGPFDVHNGPLFPEGTKINSLFIREKIVYIDFSSEFVIFEYNIPVSFSVIIEGIKKTVKFNFPGIEKILFSIQGKSLDSFN